MGAEAIQERNNQRGEKGERKKKEGEKMEDENYGEPEVLMIRTLNFLLGGSCKQH